MGGGRQRKRGKLKPDSGTEAGLRFDAVLRHLVGLWTLGVWPLHNAVVIDVDLPVAKKLSEARRSEKEAAAAAVSVVLERFGIPHLHFDSRRGSHTWIRCESEPTPEAVGALGRLLNEQPSLDGRIELRPKGALAIRLPLGVSHGIGRGPLMTELPQSELLQWLADPPRATATQLAAVVAQAPPPPPPRRAPGSGGDVVRRLEGEHGDRLNGDAYRAEAIAAPYQIPAGRTGPSASRRST